MDALWYFALLSGWKMFLGWWWFWFFFGFLNYSVLNVVLV